MTTAITSASTFTLAEEGGTVLELRERALPYRPLTISGKQRAEFTWYPGNPEATVQMLGPDEGSIQLRGYWKDRFIAGSEAAVSYNQEDLAFARQGGFSPGTGIATVADLVQLVDTMRRSGRRITLSWAGLVRVGHITGFTQTWHNVHDCEWELEFGVVSQGEGKVVSVIADAATAASQYQQYVSATLELADAVKNKPTTLPFLTEFNQAYATFEEEMFKNTSAAYSIATIGNQYLTAPGDIARRSVALLAGTVVQANTFIGTSMDRALSDVFEFSYWINEDETPFGVQLNAANTRRTLRNAATSIMYSNAVARNQLQQNLNADLTVSYVAPGNIDLRDVSTRYYGNPNEWRSLMQFNNLRSSSVAAGTVILVPRKPTGASAGSPPSRGS